MSKKSTQKLVTYLWYSKQAEEAAQFYAKVFPDSRVDRVTALQAESPSGPAGSVKVVEFTVLGQQLMAITAGPHDEFNDAMSLLVKCDTQAEIDKYWNAIIEGGGKPSACGWVNDRFGVRWQITFSGMGDMFADPDVTKARRVGEAMMKQVKIDIAALQAAYNGD